MKTDCEGRSAVVVVPREKAVFWMDSQGRWHNQHGPFEHRRIIEHFNSAIQKDADGYFVSQNHDGICEKVYFPYQETAIFVTDLLWEDPVQLILNTGQRMVLNPKLLFIRNDQLFLRKGDEIIKFSEHALTIISEKFEVSKKGYCLLLDGISYPVSECNSG